jgi:ABC-type Fe3+-hydroxamate transport system substrate-binding protein
MKKLTPKQEKFAQLAVTLGNQSEAYRQAYDVSNKGAEWIASKASHLISEDNIRARVEELRQETKKAHKIDRQWIIDQHQEIIDWYKELKTLARKKDLSKDDKARVYMLKDLIKGADYRGSLDSITKMLGLNEPEKHEVKDTSHTTEWG